MQTSDLFSQASEEYKKENAPLAYRMRPKNLSEFAGQKHILDNGKLLRRLIETDRIQSCIFFGQPGTGKTSLAHIIAETTHSVFFRLNAVEANTSDVREIIEEAKKQRDYYQKKSILFIDEIHRFNKAQQDRLLKDVEEGTISLIGATTVNPIYGLNSALVSRSRLFEFKPLSVVDILPVIHRALKTDVGLGKKNISVQDHSLKLLVTKCEGDLRQVLNNLELAALSTLPDSTGLITITDDIISEVTSAKVMPYDENDHYDLISAFIKSMRASKENDALYYLARMIKAGEDPLFLARRMVIFASEDVGLADSNALSVAINVFRACEVIGFPEAQINMSHGVIYLCRAPKNRDAYEKIKETMKRVEDLPNNPVPEHLRNWKSPKY